jgi:glycerol-3-phosphate acyltransferase PlsX
MSKASKTVRIAVDAMGGDYAPEEIIKGAVTAASKADVKIILVGPEDILKRELDKCHSSYIPVDHVRADEFIKEGEHPTLAIRHKHNTSIAVAVNLVRTGKADAIISAGPTGAASVAAIHFLGMMPGIERPALCVPLVGLAPKTVLVDGGANVDCKPHHLLSFAVIGTVYAKKLLDVANPRIAFLSIGAEEGKGGRLIQESYPLLQNSGLDFIGSIEGNRILSGQANVIVCDGIVGNVLMKFYESVGHYFAKWLTSRLDNLPLVGLVKRLLDQMILFTRITSTESDGGGLLWGVNGLVQLLHGNSRAHQVDKAIIRAKQAIETDLVGFLKSELDMIQTKCKGYLSVNFQSQQRTTPTVAAQYIYSRTK